MIEKGKHPKRIESFFSHDSGANSFFSNKQTNKQENKKKIRICEFCHVVYGYGWTHVIRM